MEPAREGKDGRRPEANPLIAALHNPDVKTRNPMKTEYIIKTVELNAGSAYLVFSVNE